MRITLDQALELALLAAKAAGADERTAASLARVTVAAEVANRPSVGFLHLVDYLDGLAAGRICGSAVPEIEFPAPTTVRVDAKSGIAQLGFDEAFEQLVQAADAYGLSLLLLSNSYTAGELGYYTRRLANKGLLSIACSNGPALATTMSSRERVYGTNPFSFAAPVANASPLVIDQASTATAFVNIRDAASRQECIPEQWALDETGVPTMDARAALNGMLLTFGGERGANIALMVEVLAAGATGGNWSMDCPSFETGSASPGVGLFVLAMSPKLFAPDFPQRLSQQLDRLKASGVYIPGKSEARDHVELSQALFDRLQASVTAPTPSVALTHQ